MAIRTNDVQRHDLTGTWTGNDGRTYEIRAVGTEIFWFGTGDGLQPKAFHGNLQSPTQYSGRWVDTPPGERRESGVMTIRVLNPNLFETASNPDGFPGRRWVRVP